MAETLNGMVLVSTWTDLESGSGELPTNPFGIADNVGADRIGLAVAFNDGVTFGDITYSNVAALWNTTNFADVAADTATGFFTAANGLHFLVNDGSSLPMAWSSFSMTYSNNFDLDYGDQLGSHFRASVAGWVSATFKTYALNVIDGDGAGNFIDGTAFHDEINGLAGGDKLDGLDGHDQLNGDVGADTLSGGAGEDTLKGGDDVDVLMGGAGADSLVGGNGVDTLDYSDATTKVTVRLWNQTATGDVATGDTIAGFESARGGAGNDAIVGSDGVGNRLVGNGGADGLYGLSGDDTLEGNAGDDTLRGSDGADVLSAGADNDTIDYSDSSSGVKVRLWNQTATDGFATGDTIAGFEHAWGGASTDALVGSFGVGNYLSGNGGNDNMQGLSGNDTLVGGVGKDTLTGGDDADTFVFYGPWGIDRITDFQGGAGAGDVLSFEGLGAAFDTFAEILAITTQSGANTIINFGGGQTITLLGFNMANLNADDFAFG